MEKFKPSDGWLFATLMRWSNYSLKDVISTGYAKNHSIFNLDEINDGLSRLIAFGFASITGKKVKATAEAKQFFAQHKISGEDFITEQVRFQDIFSNKELASKVNYVEHFSQGEYEATLKRYLKPSFWQRLINFFS